MGLVFSHSTLYGLSHAVTARAINECFKILGEILLEKEAINISVSEENLLVDGMPMTDITPAVSAIALRLSSLAIASFSLTRGITAEEFGNVVELLQATPDDMRNAGGFASIIHAVGLSHVQSRRVTIQQVTEDEMVVSKEKLSQAIGKVDAEDVLKFLKADGDSVSPGISEHILAGAADVQQIGELVMQVSGLVDGTDPAGRSDRTIGAIRRLYDNMAGSPAGRTQKGKKALVKFLEQLEGVLIENMRKSCGGEQPDAEARIVRALEEMKDELRIDSLAAEYAKKRSAISASEKRILRYIETVGWEVVQKTGLKDRLAEEGLTPDEWQDLLEKSGIADDFAGAAAEHSTAEAERAAVASDLADSLSRLGAAGSAGPPDPAAAAIDPAELDRMVAQVGDAVAKLVDQTEQKIEQFTHKVGGSGEGRPALGISRKAILEFLAEIVQELRQPLSVISSVVDSMKSGALGNLSPHQIAMLNLAGNSTERLDLLIAKLAEVSGMPRSLVPNAKILGAVYTTRENDKP